MKIGPTFSSELAAAGLAGLNIGWTPATGELTLPDTLTPEQVDAARAVLAAHDPERAVPSVIVVSKSILFQRMTDAEYDRFAPILAQQSKRVRDVYDLVATFRSDAALWPLLTGIAQGLYGDERAAELLAPTE